MCDILDAEIVPALALQYAGFVDESGVWDRLIEAANNPERVEKVFHTAPSLEPHRTWVMNVIQAAVKQMTAEAEPEPATVNGAQE